jgi:DNA polymerase/3'-5' exonuclease PolX
MKLEQAQAIIKPLVDRIAPHCLNIYVAGSIARKKPDVKDVDIVIEPIRHPTRDMFGEIVGWWSEVDEIVAEIWTDGIWDYMMDGEKHKKMQMMHHPLVVELWIVTAPAQYGVIKALRTGPADFSHQFVTARNKTTGPLSDNSSLPGLFPSWARMRDGSVWSGDNQIEMPEEEDFFKFLELEWIEPSQRKAQHPSKFKRVQP